MNGREIRNLPRYVPTLARKDGDLAPQLSRSSADCATAGACAAVARAGLYTSGGTPIGSLANYLGGSVVQQVVVDRTSLDGRFVSNGHRTRDGTHRRFLQHSRNNSH